MGYATVSDVSARNVARPPFTDQTKPTASQVIGFIEDTAGELDGILRGLGYSLPVATTATSALRALRSYNAYGAAALVEQSAQHSTTLESAAKLWEDAKAMLRCGEVELDAAKDSTNSSVRFPSTPSPCFSAGMDF